MRILDAVVGAIDAAFEPHYMRHFLQKESVLRLDLCKSFFHESILLSFSLQVRGCTRTLVINAALHVTKLAGWGEEVELSIRKRIEKRMSTSYALPRNYFTFCWCLCWHRSIWRCMQALFCTGIAFLPRSILYATDCLDALLATTFWCQVKFFL